MGTDGEKAIEARLVVIEEELRQLRGDIDLVAGQVRAIGKEAGEQRQLLDEIRNRLLGG